MLKNFIMSVNIFAEGDSELHYAGMFCLWPGLEQIFILSVIVALFCAALNPPPFFY